MKPIVRAGRMKPVHSDIRGPLFVEAMKRQKQGIDILKLNTGNPATFGFGLPDSIKNALMEHMQDGVGYCDFKGMPQARQAICDYETSKGINGITSDDVFIGNGVSEVVSFALTPLLNDGDEVLVPSPSYSLWGNSVYLEDGKPVFYTCDEKANWYPDIKDIRSKITDKTKAMIISFPNNPTGAIMTKEELEPIAEFAKEHDIVVISDEIYSELTYGRDHVSIASLPEMKDRSIVINGFSKAFAMTGWRLGYVAAPRYMMKQMVKVHQFCIMAAPTTSQYAAIEAMRSCDDEVEEMRTAYNQRRRFLVHEFQRMGIECFEPEGAFYIFPSIKKFGMTSEEFATKLLNEEKVAIVPGSSFGACGEGYLRVSYAYSIEELKEALGRLERFINHLPKKQ